MSLQIDSRRDTESTPTHFLDESGVFTSLAFGLDALDGGYRFLTNGTPRVENDPLDPTSKTPFEATVSPSAQRISLVSPAMVDFSLWSDHVFDDVYMHDPPSYSRIISPAPSSVSASSTPSRRQSSSDSVPPDVLQLQALPLIPSDDSLPRQEPSGSDTFESSSPSDLERTTLVPDSPSAHTTVPSSNDNTSILQDRAEEESQGGYATRAKPSAQQKYHSNNRHSDTKDEQGKCDAEDFSSSSFSKEKNRSGKKTSSIDKTKGSSGTAKTRGRNTRASSRSVVTGSTTSSTATGSKPTTTPPTPAVTKSSRKKTEAKQSHPKHSKGASKTGSKKQSKSSKAPKNTQTGHVVDDIISAYDSEEDGEDSEMDDVDMDPETMTLTGASSRKHSLADESESEAKRQKFLERNRQAAHRCREKKRLQTLKTIADADLITTRNQELHENLDALQEEVRMLKNQILCHRDCGCDVVQQFVKSTFGFAANSSFPKPAAVVNCGEGGGGGGGLAMFPSGLCPTSLGDDRAEQLFWC